MRRSTVLSAVAAVLAVGSAACAPGAGPGPGRAATACFTRNTPGPGVAVVGLVADNTLVCFSDRSPRATFIGAITGLDQDTGLIGIDYRPGNSVLYGVGNGGGLYSIDVSTAIATKVSQLNQPLEGASFGVDFNPTVDRLRIVSDTGQNLRVSVDDGAAIVDGTLNIPGATPVNPATGVAGAAYTNNDFDPNTATTLYDLDTANDNMVVQSPANAGSLAPTGKLGVDASTNVGFDIYSIVSSDTTVDNLALASIATADGDTKLYSVDLKTGQATWIGTFDRLVVDLAIPDNQS